MTNKPMLSVERELLERAASAIEKHYGSLQWVIASELRALLDKEVDFLTPDCPDCACVQDGHCLCIPSKPAAQHQGEAFTYSSKQATNCAGCGLRKHTPLRVDDMGGYVCLTCIDNRLGELLGAERRQVEPVAIVDESDDGLFIEFVYGEDGNPLKRGDKLYAAPPAKRRGEPVAYADPKAFENFGNLAHLGGLYAHEWMWAEQKPGMVALYTEQPAPVARGSDEKRS